MSRPLDEKLLQEAKGELLQRGFELTGAIPDTVAGRRVTCAWQAQRADEMFYCVAKPYALDGRASFIQRIVRRAADQGRLLVFYQSNNCRFTVFDPDYVLHEGREACVRSKDRRTNIFDIPLRDGAELDRYLHHADQPSRQEFDNQGFLSQWA